MHGIIEIEIHWEFNKKKMLDITRETFWFFFPIDQKKIFTRSLTMKTSSTKAQKIMNGYFTDLKSIKQELIHG